MWELKVNIHLHADISDEELQCFWSKISSFDFGWTGKLAALWPFLGICAEVLILCAIILVYEKRRNKEGLDESDTDQSPEQ